MSSDRHETDQRAPATPERTAEATPEAPAASPFGLLSGDRGPATISAMQRTAGNQATMRALAASASPTPPADGEDTAKKPPTTTTGGDGDDDDEPKLKPSARLPGAEDPSFTGSPGGAADRPRG